MGHFYGWNKWAVAGALATLGLLAANRLPAHAIRQSQNQQPRNGTETRLAPASKPTPTYVGSNTCKICHSNVFNDQFANTPHYKTLLNKQAAKQGCEGCHGPGSVHVASGGQTPPPYDFSKMTPQQISQRCMFCHQSEHENMEFLTSVHYRNGVSCIDCHDPHHSADMRTLLIKPQPQLCYDCHKEVEPLFHMPFHHRVNEGLVQCSDCHNPHGSFADAALEPGGEGKQLRTGAAGNAICLQCHADKAGPFVFEHEPVVTDGCLSCHVPHGSPNPHMLKVANVNQLCLECHTISSFSGAPGIPSFHNQTTQFQACTLCHTQVHGSNFSPYFFK